MNLRFWMAWVVAGVALAGCVGDDDDGLTAAERLDLPYYDARDGRYHFAIEYAEEGNIHFDWAPGHTGKVRNDGPASATIELPFGFLFITGDDGMSGSFELPTSFDLAPGVTQWFLAPPSAHTVDLAIDGELYPLDPTTVNDYEASTMALVSGEEQVAQHKHQEANFPDRDPGSDSYNDAAQYFADYYADLGFEVEIDPYGTQAGDPLCAVPGAACPGSLLNVVARKPGTDPSAGAIFVGGGHYDMVPATTHAAFDDTSGTLMALELARALAPFEFKHDLYFAAWGGEEDGLLGSQFWVQTNREKLPLMKSYFNLDVVGMAWPGPIVRPDPIMIAAGPDAPSQDADGSTADPVSDDLLGWARTLQQDWFDFPDQLTVEVFDDDNSSQNVTYDLFLYEGVVSGQAGLVPGVGPVDDPFTSYAGVNAQSDHTPFMAAGVPSYFAFNADALKNPIGIHDTKDDLANWTKYMLYERDLVLEEPLDTEEEVLAGEALLAQGFETFMWFPLYHAILVDLGVYTPPTDVAPTGLMPLR